MSSPRWQRVEELFHAVLEREPGTRAAYLDEVCNGDSELRRDVESLDCGSRSEIRISRSPCNGSGGQGVVS